MEYRRPRLPTDAPGACPLEEQDAHLLPVDPQAPGASAIAASGGPATGWIEHLWEPHGLLRRFHGTVRLAQIGRSDTEVQASPQFDEVRYLIDDFLDCTSLVDIDASLVNELAAIAAVAVRHPAHFRHAVVSGLPSVRELAQEFAHSGFGAYPVRHFDTLAEARQWATR